MVMTVYLVFLFYFLFFSEAMGRTAELTDYRYNLILFKEIGRFIRHWDKVGIPAVILNIGGNVAAFLPFGCLAASLLSPKEKWYLITVLSFELSLCVEILQLCTKLGSFDVDDLLLNTLGGLGGYLLFFIWKHYLAGLHTRSDNRKHP